MEIVVVPLVMVTFVTLTIGLIVFIQKYNRKRVLKVLEPVAARYGGSLQPGGMFSLPSLHLDVGGAEATVTIFPGAKNSPPNTICTVPVNVLDQHYLHARPAMFGDGLGKFLGMQDLEVGAQLFDEKFVIKGKDQRFAAEYFAPALQDYLLSKHGQFVHLTLQTGALRVGCNRFPKEPADVEWVIEGMLLARQRLKETAPDFV